MANGADGSITIDTQLDSTGFQRGSDKMKGAINGLRQKVNQVGKDMSGAVNSINPAFKALGSAASQADNAFQTNLMSSSDFAKQMTDLQKSASQLASQLGKLGEAERMGFKTEAQMNRYALNIDKAEQAVQSLRQRLEDLSDTPVNTTKYDALKAEWLRMDAILGKLYKKQADMEQLGVRKNTMSWKRLALQIKEAEDKLYEIEGKMEESRFDDSSAMWGGDSGDYQSILAQFHDMSAALEQYKRIAEGFNVVSDPAEESEESLKDVDKELKQKPKDAKGASSAFKGLSNIFKNVASVAGRAIKGIHSAISSLKNFSKQGSQTSLSSKGLIKSLLSIKTMLLSRIKRTFISAIFKNLQSGMQSFARYSSAFNTAMSSMNNSLTGLSGNIAVFAGNLISTFGPAISQVIDWVAQLMSYINAFFALISGKSTYTVAKKGTDDYAKSLGGAGGAAKDLKNQVYGFDELNKENDSNSGGGSGSGGKVKFGEEQISSLPSALLDFMQSIKDAFSAEAFEEVGSIVAEGLNSIIYAGDEFINERLRPVAVRWSTNIARIINGFVDTLDWNALGEFVAGGFNTVVDTVGVFISTINWGTMAESFAAGLDGIVGTIEWDLLGQTLGEGFQALQTIMWGTLAAFDWVGLGSSLATGIDSLFASVDWELLGTMLSDSFKGILNGISALIAETDWQAIGNDLATFIGSIDYAGIAEALSNGIGTALAGLASLIWGFVKGAWGDAIQWWHNTAYQDGQFTISGLLNGIVQAIASIGTWIKEHIFQPFIDGFKSVFGIASPSTVMEEMGGFLIDGLINGITTAWNGITEFLSGALEALSGLISGAWDAINSAASTMWNTITTTVTTTWNKLKTKAGTIWTNIKTTITNKFDQAKTAISNTATLMLNTVSTTWGDIKSNAEEKWEAIKNAATTAWEAIKNAIGDTWNGVKTVVSTVTDTVTTGLATAWENITSAATTAWEGITSAISTAFDGVKTVVSTVTDTVTTGLDTAWENITSAATTAWEGITSAISTAFDGVKLGVSAITDTLAANLSGAWDGIKRTASSMWGSISDVISGAVSNLSNLAVNIPVNIKQTVSSAVEAGKNIITGVGSGITSAASKAKTALSTAGSNLVNGFKNLMGIKSPSKVFAGLGKYMMDGLSVGIDDEKRYALSNISNVADAISKEFSDSSDLYIGNSDTVNSLSKINDKLSETASIFNGIADALTRMDGLNVPDVAMGSVLPFRTRISDFGEDSALTNDLRQYQSGMDDNMNSVLNLMQEIIDAIRSKNFEIDGDTLERSITGIRAGRERAFGGI